MKTVLSLRSVQHTSNENKMFVAQKIAAYRRSDQETNDLRYPKYVSLRCCSIQPNLRLAPAIVCACCSVGAPAELLLLFLPPRPRADSLSKQALSLPSRWGDSFPNGCRAHDYYFLFFIYSVECLQMLELDLKKVKNHTRVTGRTCLSSCGVFFILCQLHKQKWARRLKAGRTARVVATCLKGFTSQIPCGTPKKHHVHPF